MYLPTFCFALISFVEIVNLPMLPSMFLVPICQKFTTKVFIMPFTYYNVMNVLEPLQLFVGYEILLDII